MPLASARFGFAGGGARIVEGLYLLVAGGGGGGGGVTHHGVAYHGGGGAGAGGYREISTEAELF